MTERPKPPEGYDANPPLDDAFFARAVPADEEARIVALASRDEAARLRAALEAIVEADRTGAPTAGPIRRARQLLAS